MPQIQSSQDMIGALSQADISSQDIQTIINEFNKLQDQLTSGNIRQNQQNLIVFDNTTNRVLMGYQTVLQQWGLFVSKIGVDVTQATADQMIFNSNQNVFKIVKTGTGSVTVLGSSTDGTATVPHGLGFTPACLGFMELTPGEYTPIGVNLALTNGANSGKIAIISYISVDATNVYIQVSLPDIVGHSTSSYAFRYYLLQETAN